MNFPINPNNRREDYEEAVSIIMRRFTPAEIERIKTEYALGISIGEIAESLVASDAMVARILHPMTLHNFAEEYASDKRRTRLDKERAAELAARRNSKRD